jgi:hypothetical protein
MYLQFELKSGADYNMAHDYDKAKPQQVVVHFHQNLSGRPPRVAQKKASAGDLHLH